MNFLTLEAKFIDNKLALPYSRYPDGNVAGGEVFALSNHTGHPINVWINGTGNHMDVDWDSFVDGRQKFLSTNTQKIRVERQRVLKFSPSHETMTIRTPHNPITFDVFIELIESGRTGGVGTGKTKSAEIEVTP